MWIVTTHHGKFAFNREAYAISFSHIPIKNTTTFFFNIKVNTTSKTVSQEREEEKATHSSQVRIVFLPTIATYFKCWSYSYRKPKRISWKNIGICLNKLTGISHCNEVSRYFMCVFQGKHWWVCQGKNIPMT